MMMPMMMIDSDDDDDDDVDEEDDDDAGVPDCSRRRGNQTRRSCVWVQLWVMRMLLMIRIMTM